MGFWNPIVALAIATTKATLVVLFFMHVKYSTKLTKLTVGAAVFMFLTLVSMTLADYMSRAWEAGRSEADPLCMRAAQIGGLFAGGEDRIAQSPKWMHDFCGSNVLVLGT